MVKVDGTAEEVAKAITAEETVDNSAAILGQSAFAVKPEDITSWLGDDLKTVIGVKNVYSVGFVGRNLEWDEGERTKVYNAGVRSELKKLYDQLLVFIPDLELAGARSIRLAVTDLSQRTYYGIFVRVPERLAQSPEILERLFSNGVGDIVYSTSPVRITDSDGNLNYTYEFKREL